MRRIAFLPEAFEHFNLWSCENKKIHTRIIELIRDIGRDPFSGIGKPEPLKHKLRRSLVKTNNRRASFGL